MANPRNVIDHTDVQGTFSTYKIDAVTIVYDGTKAGGAATTMIGKAVSLSAADTVQLAADGEAIVGKLIKVEADNKATVQDGGYVTLPAGAGATLTLGLKIVGDLDTAARGFIREAASGTAAEINKGRGFIVNAADTAAVVVRL